MPGSGWLEPRLVYLAYQQRTVELTADVILLPVLIPGYVQYTYVQYTV